MAEINQITFSYKDVAEALVKYHGIHEGIWGIYVEFGFAAANIGQSDQDLEPASVAKVAKIGIQRFSSENNLTVDASKVNPIPKPKRKQKTKSKN